MAVYVEPTAFELLCRNGTDEMIRRHVVDVQHINEVMNVLGETRLTYSVKRGNERVVSILLERDDLDVNLRNPLSIALYIGSIDIFKMLLKAGANPNLPCGPYDDTTLHSACELNAIYAIVDLLPLVDPRTQNRLG